MQKIPTLFVRDEIDRRYVTAEVTPGCDWVLAGEGVPTRKYDGTCVMFDGSHWYARREVKQGKLVPPGFESVNFDEMTGKTVGWEPIEQSAFAKYHAEAVRAAGAPGVPWPKGTYELFGPKVNGNPEGTGQHLLVRHSWAPVRAEMEWHMPTNSPRRVMTGASALVEVIHDAPRTFDGLAAFFVGFPHEGIVFHHPDGRMAKIKRRDFPADAT